jgi:hypothetical protein
MGIALETTYKALDESVSGHLYVSPIIYRPYTEGKDFTDEMDHLMHKRQGFVYESECRILKFDDAHYAKWISPDANVEPLPQYYSLPWALSEQSSIVISPFASWEYADRARSALKALPSVSESRIRLSPLHQQCTDARF